MTKEKLPNNSNKIYGLVKSLKEQRSKGERPSDEFINDATDTVYELLEITTKEELIELLELFVETLSPDGKPN